MKNNKGLFVQALAFFLLLSVIHTWPLATSPAHLSRNDTADTVLNEWIISWVSYSLFNNPLHLFNANIFYPESRTLAFSEPLLFPAVIGTPLRWLGASPVLTYNLLLLLGFALTGLAMYRLIWIFTGDHLAGLMAGSLIAFNAHTLTRLPHLQAHYALCLPLAFLSLDRLLIRRKTKDALWLAFFLILLTATSGYLGVFAIVAIGVGFIIRADDWWGSRAFSIFSRVGLAGVLTCLSVMPLLLPYWHVHKYQGLSRSLKAIALFSATFTSYLSTGGRIHYSLWSNNFYKIHSESLFPGIVAIALSITALVVKSQAFSNRRIRMFLGIGAAGVLLSFGPSIPLYAWCYHIFPPLKAIRAPSRFGYLFLVALAALAGYGLAKLRQRYARFHLITLLSVCLLILANLEASRVPLRYTRFEGISPIYKMIASRTEPSVVAEIPFYLENRVSKNTPYMLASTEHWKPILNGYSGFTPMSYVRRAKVLWHFPSEDSIRELQQAGATHVVVHFKRYEGDKAEQVQSVLSRHPKLSLLACTSDGISLYLLQK